MIAARIQGKPAAAPGAGQKPKTLQTAIEELPPFRLANLKAGDALILSCTNGGTLAD